MRTGHLAAGLVALAAICALTIALFMVAEPAADERSNVAGPAALFSPPEPGQTPVQPAPPFPDRDLGPAVAAAALLPCQLPAIPGSQVHVGFPMSPVRLDPSGTARIAAIFVDYSNAPATETTEQTLARNWPQAEEYLESVSNGHLDIDLRSVPGWLRMSQPSTGYGFEDGLTFNEHRDFIAEAIALADPTFDFTDIDAVWVFGERTAPGLNTSPAFVPPTTAYGIAAEGGAVIIMSAVTRLSDWQADATPGLDFGEMVMLHETLHNLGLADLYTYGDGYPQLHRYVGEFDPMSSLFGDHPFVPPFQSTYKSNELFAWHAWQLGWIEDAQVACPLIPMSSHQLTPAHAAGGTKAVVAPMTSSMNLVVEARSPARWDADMGASGLLMYTVDASIPSGYGPVRVQGVSTGRWPDGSVLLQPGESRTVDGVRVHAGEQASGAFGLVLARNECDGTPITTNAVPLACDAFEDAALVNPLGTLLIDVTGNDGFAPGAVTALQVIDAPLTGQAVVQDGQIRYTATATRGEDPFSYQVCSGVVCDIATVNMSVVDCEISGVLLASVLSKSECGALEALHGSTNGAGWRTTTGWTTIGTATPTDPCGWHGLTCDADGLSGLALSDNGLFGLLPAEFAGLPNLATLDLSNNGCLTADAATAAFVSGLGQASALDVGCTAADDLAAARSPGSVLIDVITNDTFAPSAVTVLRVDAAPVTGQAVVEDGQIRYSAMGAATSDSFSYQVCSGTFCDTATVRVTVTVLMCKGKLVTIDMNGNGGNGTGTDGDDVILGTPGPDVIDGGLGSDTVCGEGGDDMINGGAGSFRDFLFGGDGVDTINGGFGIDYIYGEDGADILDGDGGSDRMWGGPGDDEMLGDSGADRMFGGPGNDTMRGMGGQDFMWGELGNDVMQGNFQTDNMWGGPGDDDMFGAGGKDSLFGEAGNDDLFGGNNTDYLDGGDGVDTANGGRGRDKPLMAPSTRASNGQLHSGSGCIAETVANCQPDS